MKRSRIYNRKYQSSQKLRSISQFTYLTLQKSCFNKKRYDSKVRVSEEIVYGFNSSGRFLKYYKCPNCKGYHLTKKKANKSHLQQAKDFLKWGCEV